MGEGDGSRRHVDPLRPMADGTAPQPGASPDTSAGVSAQTPGEMRARLTALEAENEQLRRTQAELESSRARYFDLYDFAPVGYLSLDRNGAIDQANLAVSAMLGVPRGSLAHAPFGRYVVPEDKGTYEAFRRSIADDGSVSRSCELRLKVRGDDTLWVRMESAASHGSADSLTRVILIDINATNELERALGESEERYRALLDSAHDAVYVLAVSDDGRPGRILEVNERSCEMLGYTREELVGMETSQIDTPEQTGRAAAIVEQLRLRGFATFETEHVRKNGRAIPVEVSASLIVLRGEPTILSVARDITERRRAESLAASRITIAEYAHGHTLDEVIQKALDEAEAITDSKVGFFHFVNEDQESLLLQMWSTNTLATQCTAEGKGSHYPIAEAGVWADCLREGRPIIQNDYKSAPGRRGTPEGHAEIVRFLTVPVSRGNLIRAIVGVGNKETDYDEGDLNALTTLSSLVIDVVQAKRADEALRDSQEHLQAILDNTPLLIYVKDLEGRLTLVNRRTESIFGPRETLLGKTSHELMPRDVADAHRANDLEVMRSRKPMSFEEHNEEADGGHTYLSTKFPLIDSTGRVYGVGGISADITERIRAEAALRESEDKFKHVFDQSTVPKSITLPTGEVEVNDALCSMLGYTREELANKTTWMQLTHPDDVEETRRQMAALLSGEKTSARYEKRFVRKDGSIVWADLSSSLRRDAHGEPLHFITTIVDITERKAAQEALSASEQHYQSLFENMLNGYARCEMVFDESGRPVDFIYLEVNDAFGRLTGLKDVIGKRVTEIIPGISQTNPELFEIYGRVAVSGVSETFEIDFTPLDMWLEVSVYGTVRGQFTAIFEDISERKQAEEARERTVALLEAALSSVTHVVSHVVELRDPYTAGHQRRVAELAVAIAEEMDMPADQVEQIRTAGLIHDVGKVSVPAEILSKPGKLTRMEFELIKAHAQAGFEIIASAQMEGPIAEIVHQHHERCDGSGYPRGLNADELLPESKVLMVADVVEAMVSHRPYRPGLGLDAALSEIELGGGRAFDAKVAAACMRVLTERGFAFSDEQPD